MASSSISENQKKEVEKSFKTCQQKIEDYIQSLKKFSSEEILNGSIEEAQKILTQIIPIENSSKELLEYHKDFMSKMIFFGEESPDAPNKKPTGSPLEDKPKPPLEKKIKSDEKEISSSKTFRLSILKALIYLGGSARLNEVMDFIERDLKNKMKPGDFEKLKNNELKWQKMVKIERDNMTNEGLLSSESSSGTWEIVQKGIDYLSKHGK